MKKLKMYFSLILFILVINTYIGTAGCLYFFNDVKRATDLYIYTTNIRWLHGYIYLFIIYECNICYSTLNADSVAEVVKTAHQLPIDY